MEEHNEFSMIKLVAMDGRNTHYFIVIMRKKMLILYTLLGN